MINHINYSFPWECHSLKYWFWHKWTVKSERCFRLLGVEIYVPDSTTFNDLPDNLDEFIGRVQFIQDLANERIDILFEDGVLSIEIDLNPKGQDDLPIVDFLSEVVQEILALLEKLEMHDE